MRTCLLVFLLLAPALYGCVGRRVAWDQFEEDLGPKGEVLMYRKGEAEPFSGFVVHRYPDGNIMEEIPYRNGIRSGTSRLWYANGQIRYRGVYRNGQPNGKREEWYENGRRETLGMVREGLVTGKYTTWYSNGVIRCTSWADDEGNIMREIHWYPSGQKRCVRVWENSGWRYIEEWSRQGKPILGTEEQRRELEEE